MGKEREELRIWRLASVNAVRHINHAADYFQEYLLLGGPEAIATLQSTVRKLQKQNELTKQDAKLDKFRKIQQDLEEADKVIAVLRNILTEEGHGISDSQIDDRIRRKLFKHNLLYGASREQLLAENRQLRAQLEQSVITCRTTRDPSVHSRHRPSSGSTLPVVEGGEGGWWDGSEGGMEAPNARNKSSNNGMSSRRQSMPGLSENNSDGEERRLNNSNAMPIHTHSMRQRSAVPLLPSKSQIRQVEMKHAPHLDVINRLRAAGLNLSDAEKYFRLPSVSNAEIQVEDTTRQQLVSSESQVAALASHKQHLLTQVSDLEDRIQVLSERLEASHLTISDLKYEKTQSMASMQQQIQTLIQTVQGCSNGYPPTFPILAATARTASVPGMMPGIPCSSSPIPPPPPSSRPLSPRALSLSPPQSRPPVSSSSPKAWGEEALRHRSDDSTRRRDMNRRAMNGGGYEGRELLRSEKDGEVGREDERDEDQEGGQDAEGKERSQRKYEVYLQRDEKPYRAELVSRKGTRSSEDGGGGLRREDGAFLSSKPRDESFLKEEGARSRGTAKPVSMRPSQGRGNPEDKSPPLLVPPPSLPHSSISPPLPSSSVPPPSSSSSSSSTAAAVTTMATGNTRGRITNSSSSKMMGDEVGGRAKSPKGLENDFYPQYPNNSMNGLTTTTTTTTTNNNASAASTKSVGKKPELKCVDLDSIASVLPLPPRPNLLADSPDGVSYLEQCAEALTTAYVVPFESLLSRLFTIQAESRQQQLALEALRNYYQNVKVAVPTANDRNLMDGHSNSHSKDSSSNDSCGNSDGAKTEIELKRFLNRRWLELSRRLAVAQELQKNLYERISILPELLEAPRPLSVAERQLDVDLQRQERFSKTVSEKLSSTRDEVTAILEKADRLVAEKNKALAAAHQAKMNLDRQCEIENRTRIRDLNKILREVKQMDGQRAEEEEADACPDMAEGAGERTTKNQGSDAVNFNYSREPSKGLLKDIGRTAIGSAAVQSGAHGGTGRTAAGTLGEGGNDGEDNGREFSKIHLEEKAIELSEEIDALNMAKQECLSDAKRLKELMARLEEWVVKERNFVN